MNNDLSQFIEKYNCYMRKRKDFAYIYTMDEILIKLRIKFVNITKNVYDKIGELYPTIKKYTLMNFFKIYFDGKQKLIEKDVACHLCDKSFVHNSSVMYDKENNNSIIHGKCNLDRINLKKYNIIREKFKNNNICKICNEECDESDYIVMGDNEHDFYHKFCCVKKVKAKYKKLMCQICNENLFPDINKHKLEFCFEIKNKDEEKYVHVICAKTTTVKYKKEFAHTNFNKCGVCKFYIIDEEYVHNRCLNVGL
jgi:hypothetical protein